METTPPTPPGSQEKSALEFSHFLIGVVGPYGHALTLTPSRGRDESGTPSLQRLLAAFTGNTSPSDSLSARPHFTFRLIGTVSAQRGLPSRVSPVPHQTFAACRLPYPGSVLRASGPFRAVSCLRPEMTGSATPPFGSYLTRLQSSRFRIAARSFAPLPHTVRSAEGFRRSAQTPGSLPTPGACYAAHRLAYRGGTPTRWPDTAPQTTATWSRFRTHHLEDSSGSKSFSAGPRDRVRPEAPRLDEAARLDYFFF
jgi:hypothetical protein